MIVGVKWSPDSKYIAASENEGQVLIWEPEASEDFSFKFLHKKSGVKALDWSPHERNVLASGGGQHDCFLRVWDINTFTEKQSINLFSQITNLKFS